MKEYSINLLNDTKTVLRENYGVSMGSKMD